MTIHEGTYRKVYGKGYLEGRRINDAGLAAEALFTRLHLIADDFGLFVADPALCRNKAFPRRPEITTDEVERWLGELQDVGLIRLYSHSDDLYGQIIDFERFQPTARNGKPRRSHPPPTEGSPVQSSAIQIGPAPPDLDQDQESTESASALSPPSGVAPRAASGQRLRLELAEEIYEAYPKHVGRRKAIEAIKQAIRRLAQTSDDPAGWLLARTKAYAGSKFIRTCPNARTGHYVPHPATWFTQDRFHDDDAAWDREYGREETKPKVEVYGKERGFGDARTV